MTVPSASPLVESDGPVSDEDRSADRDSGVTPAVSTEAEGVILTPAAVRKVSELLEQEGRTGLRLRLRLAVQPGGCSGMRYQLFFDDRLLDGDGLFAFPVAQDSDPDSDPDSGYESGNDE